MPSMERVDLLVGLKDQEIRIPNLFPIFPGWPQDINKHAADIVPMMNKILERYLGELLHVPHLSSKTVLP